MYREETRDVLLWDLLEKHLDNSLTVNKNRGYEGLDQYDPNFYTLDGFEKFLDELKEFRNRLLTDFDLIPREKLIDYWIIDPKWERGYDQTLTDDEKIEYARDNVGLYTDFFDRFIREMRRFIQIGRKENYTYMVVLGP